MHKNARNARISKLLAAALTLVLAVCALPLGAGAAGSDIRGAGQVCLSSGTLNVRAGASASADIIGSLENGCYVTLLESSGGWRRVSWAGGTGWCSGGYITVLDDRTANVTLSWGVLNVRRGPGTDYEIKGSLANGETVCPLWSTDGWTRVLYGGSSVGWVSSRYLSSSPAGGESAPAAPESSGGVGLSVPCYSQLDSRWRYLTLGSSGNTVGAQGCALTSLAMAESFRTGLSVTPADLLYSLRFTSGGALYLPEGYVSDYSGGYLARIRAELDAGRPVITAAKTARGAQHWVVVTGYSGSGAAASDFSINDPGAASRSTLADFFADYPVFYKTVSCP